MSVTVAGRRDTRANQAPESRVEGGRPAHPAHVAAEALVEALAAIDDQSEFLNHLAHAQMQVANSIHHRSKRLRMVTRPEILLGYEAAEQIVAAARSVKRR